MPARIVLSPRKAKPFYARHPWVFPGAIAETEGTPQDGEAVEVYSHGGAFIAHGLFNSKSRLRVRLYSWNYEQPIDEAFFHKQLNKAISFRRDTLKLTGPGLAARLVFSESDGLSGLTVDQYDRFLVVQFTSLGLVQRKQLIFDQLQQLVQPEGIYLRTERGMGEQEGIELQDELISGKLPDTPLTIREGEVLFEINLQEGQKTGFYLDQRDNHQRVAKYTPGRTMLDAFSYSGGFGLHAARAGATQVTCVDGSENALELGKRNAELNQVSHLMQFFRSDVFKYLEQQVQANARYDVISLDPPKFARSQAAVETALKGYRRLLALSLQLINDQGILVLCCCSGLIKMHELEEISAQVATEAKKPLQILERHGQPPDHPVSLACPETSYLKCLIFKVA
ncbi:MAG: class I SAM-dependent rRNA methyltransferase [Planctomycetia bacterium]|nr:class I SAM-dependent rRNA methyltransferase [Planctomycetia bacterium]